VIRRKAPDDAKLSDLTGYVWGLVVACSMTFAAVIGQLSCLALLAWELIGGGFAGWVGVGAVIVLMLLATYYAALTVTALANRKWEDEAKAAVASAKKESAKKGLTAAGQPPAPQISVATPRWSLL
jgi:hypothetical protein